MTKLSENKSLIHPQDIDYQTNTLCSAGVIFLRIFAPDFYPTVFEKEDHCL